MRKAMEETSRRRAKQIAYNTEHGINPETIFKTRDEIIRTTLFADSKTFEEEKKFEKPDQFSLMSSEDQLAFMMTAMKKAAENLEFETAIAIRDEINQLRKEKKHGLKRKRR
jgi:excinuclease ABC subunit B